MPNPNRQLSRSLMSRWRKIQLVFEGFVVVIIVLEIAVSDELLLVETPATEADAIIAVGGEPGKR